MKAAKQSAQSKAAAKASATKASATNTAILGAPGPAPGPAPAPGPQPFIGQIALFAFGYAPAGWLPCDGRLLPIMQNQQLMSLLGTTYGGNGETTLGLPDLKPAGPSGPGYYIAVQGAFPNR